MSYYIYRQHSEHFPIPDLPRAITSYGIKHHEAADKETDHDSKLGIGQF